VLTFGRKRCPQCAEWVRNEALICRYCKSSLTVGVHQHPRGKWGSKAVIIGSVLTLCLAGAVALGMWSAPKPVAKENLSRKPQRSAAPVKAQLAALNLTAFPIDSGVEWRADSYPSPISWQLGPMVVTASVRRDGELSAPNIEIEAAGTKISMQGEMVSSSYTHRLSAITNRAGTYPVLMLQSFSGGAHCCNSVQVAGLSGGKLKAVNLGAWDGDQIELPKDVSGDGFADYVFYDNSFLYAFAPYAYSYAPPKILNVRNGRAINVSSSRAFRRFFEKTIRETEGLCDPSQDSFTRNGACPAFVAAAARLGKIDQAWSRMVASYDASADWQLPTGCRIKTRDSCPENLQIQFQSYPDALLSFLKDNGYVAQNWYPRSGVNLSEPALF
jgi:hypothetical protein